MTHGAWTFADAGGFRCEFPLACSHTAPIDEKKRNSTSSAFLPVSSWKTRSLGCSTLEVRRRQRRASGRAKQALSSWRPERFLLNTKPPTCRASPTAQFCSVTVHIWLSVSFDIACHPMPQAEFARDYDKEALVNTFK